MKKNQLILSIHSLEILQISELHDLKDNANFSPEPPKNK